MSGALTAAPRVDLHKYLDGSEVIREIQIFKDRENKFDINSIRERANEVDWLPFLSRSPILGYMTHPVWVRFTLHNSGKKPVSYFLIHDHPSTDWMYIYKLSENGLSQEIIMGDALPFRMRPVAELDFITPGYLSPNQERTFYIRLQSRSTISTGFFLKQPDVYNATNSRKRFLDTLYLGLLIGLLLYNLFVYFSVREPAYLYYVIYVFGLIFFSLLYVGFGAQFIWPDSVWIHNEGFNYVLVSGVISVIIFARAFLNLEREMPWLNRWLNVLILFFALTIFVFFLVSRQELPVIPGQGIQPTSFSIQKAYQIRNIFLQLTLVSLLLAGIRMAMKGQRAGWYFTLAFGFFLIGAAGTLFTSMGILPAGLLTRRSIMIGSVLEALLLSFALADRINIMGRKLKVLSEDLEDKVVERTQELDRAMARLRSGNERLKYSYREIRKLKKQQDTDYFLTSALLTPLMQNDSKSDFLKVEFLVNQKKHFRFKKWDCEIGGDICISHFIELQGKRYLAFANGDAMGKSMQGAGGILGFRLRFSFYSGAYQNSGEASPRPHLISGYRRPLKNYKMLLKPLMGICYFRPYWVL